MKSEAIVRNHEVEKVEDLIKKGENWQFPWMAEGGKKKLIRLSVSDAIEKFYAVKMLDNLKPMTFEAYRQGFSQRVLKAGNLPLQTFLRKISNFFQNNFQFFQKITNIYEKVFQLFSKVFQLFSKMFKTKTS